MSSSGAATLVPSPHGAALPGFAAAIDAPEAIASQPRPVLRLQLSAGYAAATTLQDVSLQLDRGERLGVVGSSGAGKSTLALAAMGLLPWRGGWAKGQIDFEGMNLLSLRERDWRALRGRRIALVPQSPVGSLNPSLTLLKHFEEVWRAHAMRGAEDLHTRMDELLQRVGLSTETSFLKRLPTEISIGQAQRILIALALLHRPSLLIADEPTSALDVCNQADVLRLLGDLSREHRMALLYISHDLVSVVQMCDRMLVLSGGRSVETLSCDALEPRDVYHPVTRSLLQTLPAPPDVLRRHRG